MAECTASMVDVEKVIIERQIQYTLTLNKDEAVVLREILGTGIIGTGRGRTLMDNIWSAFEKVGLTREVADLPLDISMSGQITMS